MGIHERVFYHYEDLEEYHGGLWRIVRGQQRKRNMEAAADLLRCPKAFKEVMRRVLAEWPRSCEAAFTSEDSNRIAWLGQAACCLSVGSPEENTRACWNTLSQPEQDEANRVAGEVLDEWRTQYRRRTQPDLFDVMVANDA